MRGTGRGQRRIGRTGVAALVIVTAVLGAVTVRVGRVSIDRSPDRSPAVRAELRALRSALDGGAGTEMQARFPEGFFFMHALHGLAWTDLAAGGGADAGTARAEAQHALDQLDGPEGIGPFSASQRPPRGVFYSAWTLLLHAQLVVLASDDRNLRSRVAAEADTLARAYAAELDAGRSPFLESYPAQSWPVDSVVAMAALRTADRVIGSEHGPLVDRWLAHAGGLLDPATGLLPHRTEPGTGRAIEGPRATSQSIIQRFWPTVDRAGAPRSYGRFRDLFVTPVLGGVAVREYPPGVEGAGDVDSGPIVAGLSASATAVTIAAARANGDLGLATALTQEAEVLGVSFLGRRRYLLGAMPVADAFLAWARATPLTVESPQPDLVVWWPLLVGAGWVPVLVAWWWVIRRRRRRRVSPGTVATDAPVDPTAFDAPVPAGAPEG